MPRLSRNGEEAKAELKQGYDSHPRRAASYLRPSVQEDGANFTLNRAVIYVQRVSSDGLGLVAQIELRGKHMAIDEWVGMSVQFQQDFS